MNCAFARRLVIEVRQDPAVTEQGTGTFMVTNCGRAATQARVELGYAGGERVYQAASGAIPEFPELCSAKFQVPGTKAQELLVWLHRVTPDSQSESLPARLKVTSGKEIRDVQVDGASQQLVVPLFAEEEKESKGRSGETGQIDVEVQLATAAAEEK